MGSWLGQHWLDIVLHVILGLFLYAGWKIRFIRGLFTLIGIVGGIILAGVLADSVGGLLKQWISNPNTARWIGFIIVVAVTLLVAAIIAYYIGRRTEESELMQQINVIGGMLIGVIVGLILCGVALRALARFQFMTTAISTSNMVPDFIYPFTRVIGNILPDTPGWLGSVKEFLTGL